jgi:hypothetical protein
VKVIKKGMSHKIDEAAYLWHVSHAGCVFVSSDRYSLCFFV